MDFRTGAFVGGHSVKPVIVSYAVLQKWHVPLLNLVSRYPHTSFNPSWESIDAIEHLFKLVTQISTKCKIHFLPIYHPSEEEKTNPKLYAENVQKVSRILF